MRGDFLSHEKPAEAGPHYQQALATYDQLIAAHGINPYRAAGLGWTCTNLARALMRTKPTAEVFPLALRSLEMREYLDKNRLDAAANRQELEVSYALIADVLSECSDVREPDLQRVIDSARVTTTQDVSHGSAWRVLRVALYRQELAQAGVNVEKTIERLIQAKKHRNHAALLQQEGNKSEAAEEYRLSIDLYAQLANESPKADFPQRALIETTLEALPLLAKDDVSAWKANIGKIEDMRRQLKELGTSEKQDLKFDDTLVRTFMALMVYPDRAKLPQDLREYVSEKGLAVATHMEKLDPKGHETLEALFSTHQIRGDFLFEEQKPAEAVPHYQQALVSRNQLIAVDGINPYRADGLGWTCTLLIRALMGTEPAAKVFPVALQSLEMREYLDKNRPDAARNRQELDGSYEDVAKVLAHWPDVSDTDLQKATQFARERTVKDPTLLLAWRALGVLLVRQKHYEEACQALRKANEGDLPDKAYDLFFLAISLEQLGQHKEAQEFLAQGSAWVAAKQPNNKLLKSLEQEATRLVKP